MNVWMNEQIRESIYTHALGIAQPSARCEQCCKLQIALLFMKKTATFPLFDMIIVFKRSFFFLLNALTIYFTTLSAQ